MTAQTITRTRKTTSKEADRPRWLSYPEASEMCTLSVRSLKRCRRRSKSEQFRHAVTAQFSRAAERSGSPQAGKLPCYVVGGKVLWLKASDVEALIVPADQCGGW